MAEGVLQATKAAPTAARQAPAARADARAHHGSRRMLSQPGEAAERNVDARPARALSGAFPAQSRSLRQRYARALAEAKPADRELAVAIADQRGNGWPLLPAETHTMCSPGRLTEWSWRVVPPCTPIRQQGFAWPESVDAVAFDEWTGRIFLSGKVPVGPT